jgi:hypothetical protein
MNSNDKSEVRETLESILQAASKAKNEPKENSERAGESSSFEVLHSLSSGDESKTLNKPS